MNRNDKIAKKYYARRAEAEAAKKASQSASKVTSGTESNTEAKKMEEHK